MSPRTGRPPKQENPRNVSLNVRLTKEEAETIQKCAADLGISRTDTIMKGINLLKVKLKK